MKVLNSFIALGFLILIAGGMYMGWRFYEQCQADGHDDVGSCIVGNPGEDLVEVVEKGADVIENSLDVVDTGIDIVESGANVIEAGVDVVEDTANNTAEIITSASCDQQFGSAAFQDPNGRCYSCPTGMERTFSSVTANDACKFPGFERISRATFERSSHCDTAFPGSFFDPRNGGECWSCPSGYNRTIASVTASDACDRLRQTKATDHGKATGFFGTDCGSGQFWDPNGRCYSCPSGLVRTTLPVTGSQACDGIQRSKATFHGPGGLGCPDGSFQDPRNGGECWSCPSGYKRSVAAVTAENACSRSNDLDTKPATDHGFPN